MTIAIVGAGPAGLTLAYILDGNIPFYDPDRFGPHPDSRLHRMLLACPNLLVAASDQKILDYVQAHVQSFFSAECSAPSLLLDTLRTPSEANLQNQHTMQPRIAWKRCPDLARKFKLFGGSGGAGGQWTDTSADSEESKVLSYSEMLSLPGWTFGEFYKETYGEEPADFLRPPRGAVARYYQRYAERMGLVVEDDTVGDIVRTPNGFSVVNVAGELLCEASDVVLASGISSAKTETTRTEVLAETGPVVVVGTGVSAADAVLDAYPSQVLHIYKWQSPSGEPTPLRRYSKKLYPEYAQAFEYMKARKGDNYQGIPNGNIASIDGDKVKLQKENGEVVEVRPRQIITRAGRVGSLSYARHITPQSLEQVSKNTLRSLEASLPQITPHVWVVGSLTGDSLVRYILGPCCAAAGRLVQTLD